MSWHKLIYTQAKREAGPIILPASKSIANRLLILQNIASEHFEIENLSNANDTILLKEILSNKKIPNEIDCQDAGTAFRFMTCLCAATPGQRFTITGTETLLQRPMEPLIDALIAMGAQIRLIISDNKISALEIVGQQLKNKKITIAGDISSQFVSGLCLISPLIKNGLTLSITKPVLSTPYINLTLDLLAQLGIESTFTNEQIVIKEQNINTEPMQVTPDWSAATFFYAFMILNPNLESLRIEKLGKLAIQGDSYIARLTVQLGIKTTFDLTGASLTRTEIQSPPSEIDLSNYPDLAIPLIVSCAFEHPNIRFTGLSHLRIKESDRILALQSNLEKFGIMLNEKNGILWIEKKELLPAKTIVRIKTYDDHRIAMAFSLLATLGHEIHLDNTKCIDKSFPDFLAQILKLGIATKN